MQSRRQALKLGQPNENNQQARERSAGRKNPQLWLLTSREAPPKGAAIDEGLDARSPWLQLVIGRWQLERGRGVALRAPEDGPLFAPGATLLVHGVARPRRPTELESLFLFQLPTETQSARHDVALLKLELLTPYLHQTLLRVRSGVVDGSPSQISPAESAVGISPRERQILQWVQNGKTNAEIAKLLHISPLTVKNHLHNVFRKLGVRNRAQAMSTTLARGQLDAPSGEDQSS